MVLRIKRESVDAVLEPYFGKDFVDVSSSRLFARHHQNAVATNGCDPVIGLHHTLGWNGTVLGSAESYVGFERLIIVIYSIGIKSFAYGVSQLREGVGRFRSDPDDARPAVSAEETHFPDVYIKCSETGSGSSDRVDYTFGFIVVADEGYRDMDLRGIGDSDPGNGLQPSQDGEERTDIINRYLDEQSHIICRSFYEWSPEVLRILLRCRHRSYRNFRYTMDPQHLLRLRNPLICL